MVFIVDTLPHYKHERSWTNNAFGVCHNEPDEDDKTSIEWLKKHALNTLVPMYDGSVSDYYVQAGYNAHKRIRAEQRRLLRNPEDTFTSIHSHLSKLVNIKAFALEGLTAVHGDLRRPLHVLRPKEQSWFTFDDGGYASSSFEIIVPKLLKTVLNALLTNILPSLQSLKAVILDYTDFEEFQIQISTAKSSLQSVQSLLLFFHGSLAAIEYGESPYLGRLRCSREKNGAFFQDLLASTPNLRKLKLFVETTPRLSTKMLFQEHQYIHLHTLELSEMNVDSPSFETFLLAHAERLCTLWICDSNMLSNTKEHHIWIRFLKLSQQRMNLTDFRLDGDIRERETIRFCTEIRCTSDTYNIVPIDRVIQYLVCGKVTDFFGVLDDASDVLLERNTLSWKDVECAYIQGIDSSFYEEG